MSIEVGQQAPDFELRDQHGTPVRLSRFRGSKNVVLVFYPLAFSGVCSGELCAMRDAFPEVSADSGTVLLTVSVDSTFTHRAWADQEHFEFGLLSDFWPHGSVAAAYGVFDAERGIAVRGTFVIDKDGVVRWKVVNPIPQARDIADYQKALAALAVLSMRGPADGPGAGGEPVAPRRARGRAGAGVPRVPAGRRLDGAARPLPAVCERAPDPPPWPGRVPGLRGRARPGSLVGSARPRR